MAKGGYRVLDMKGIDVPLGGGADLPGVYDFIEETIGKPILITNFKYSGVEQNSVFVNFRSVSGNYQGMWAAQNDGRMYVFMVRENDKVSLFYTPAPAAPADEQVSGEDGPSASM